MFHSKTDDFPLTPTFAMVLYIPWQDQEQLFKDARRSLDVCQPKWKEWGEDALDLKNQLKQVVKESWLS
jgi:hypothetical protein